MKTEDDVVFNEVYRGSGTSLTLNNLKANTEHSFRVRAVCGNEVSRWCEIVNVSTLERWYCAWKECPDNVDEKRKYVVDKANPRIASKYTFDKYFCFVMGDTPLPPNRVTSWNIKILGSMYNNGGNIFIGIAPSDINQNDGGNFGKCGWYFYCYDSTLHSGPPHNYSYKAYGPRKGSGQYVCTDSVGVMMDTTNGELSFVVDGVNLGVAYDVIPLDKPLVPSVLLRNVGDSVELDTSEVKETKVNSSIPIPSNVTTKSITWDTVTLSWDDVKVASFYQIEVSRHKLYNSSMTKTFTRTRLTPETEYSFRIRAVYGNEVSEWSDAVKGRTYARLPASTAWKECPDYVGENRKYSVDEKNPRIATKTNDDNNCTIIGNTAIPLNKVVLWNIKILKSMNNDGRYIFIVLHLLI